MLRDPMWNRCIFTVINDCELLPCAQLQREAVILGCYLGGLARAAPCLLQLTPRPRCPAVIGTCRHCDIEAPATNRDGVSATLAAFGLAGGSDVELASK